MKFYVLTMNQLRCSVRPVLLRIPVLLLLLVMFTLTGCKSDDGDEFGFGDDTFTAMVDGVSYVATEIYDAGYKNDRENLFVVSANSSNTIELHIEGNETGEYTISSDHNNSGLYTIKDTQGIFSTQVGGSGIINLTELTFTHMKGTFSLSVSPIFSQRNPANTISITDGEFNVELR